MIYAVDRHSDFIKLKERKEFWGKQPLFEYFDTEEEAKRFIRERAVVEFAKAQLALKRARQRVSKVNRTFAASKPDAASSSPSKEAG